MVGTITDVNCAAAPQIQLTLKAQTIVMHLHSRDYSQVAIKSAGTNSAAKKPVCARSRAKRACELSAGVGKDWTASLYR